MSWTVRAAALEGVRSARSGRWLSVSLVLLAATAFAGSVGLDLHTYARTAAQLEEWEQAGGRVIVVRNAAEGIAWQDCIDVGAVPGVAGAVPVVRAQSRYTPAHTPDSARSLSITSPQIWGFLDQPAQPGEILVSSRAVGIPGPYLRLTPAPATAGVETTQTGPSAQADLPAYPLSVSTGLDLTWLGEVHGTGLVAVTARAPEPGECFVRAEPGAEQQLARALPALLTRPGAAAPTHADPLLPQGAFPRDLDQELRERPTQDLALGAGVVLGVIGILMQWIQRGGNALYRAIGLSQRHLVAARWAEWMVLMLTGILLGAAALAITAMYVWAPWFKDLASLAATAAVTVVLISTSAWTLGFLVSRGDLLTMLRDS